MGSTGDEGDQTNTGGGAYVEGSVNTGGGSFIGRDQNIAGDYIAGDLIIGYNADQVSILLEQLGSQFQPRPFDGRCPYVGLQAFQEEDSARFFGREALAGALSERLESGARFVFVAGPSGSGKSSLVRAGLIPMLKDGKLPGSQRWLFATIKPGRDPFAALGRAFAGLLGRSSVVDEFRDQGLTRPDLLAQWTEIALGDQTERRLLLFIDQFEELFTQLEKQDEPVRLAFLAQLEQALAVDDGRAIIIAAMRSDFIGQCAAYPWLNARLNQQFLQAGEMTPEELVSAIARPALEAGLRIDPDLVAQVLADMRDQPGALPLMQFALTDLFQAQQEAGGVIALTLVDYMRRGGLRLALQRHADAAFNRLDEAEQALARTIFKGLVQPGLGTVDTARTARFDELAPQGVDRQAVEALIRELADARLVTTEEAGAGVSAAPTVRLAHERLLETWPWLRRLIDENREAIALQNEIQQDAARWARSQKDESYLYTGARLETARERLDAEHIRLNDLGVAFVQAAVQRRLALEQAEQAEQRQKLEDAQRLAESEHKRAEVEARRAADQKSAADRIRRWAIGLAVVLALALAAGTLAVLAQQRAEALQRTSRSRELAALALNRLEDNPALAILLAREAVLVEQTIQAQDTLRQALYALPAHRIYKPDEGADALLASSPDGSLVITRPAYSSRWRSVDIWDAGSGEKVLELEVDGQPDSAAFSPDGHWAAVMGRGEFKLWETSTGQVRSLDLPDSYPDRVVFSPDSSTLYILGDPAIAWDAASGAQKYQSEAYSLALSPDGQRFVGWDAEYQLGIWQAGDGAWLRDLEVSEEDPPNCSSVFAFSPDNQRVMGYGGDVCIWDAATGELVLHHEPRFTFDEAAWVGGDRFLTSDIFDSEVRIWEVRTDELVMTLRETVQQGISECSYPGGIGVSSFSDVPSISNVIVSPDGQRILTTAAWFARIWDPDSGRELMSLHATCSDIINAAFSSDQRRMILLDEEGIVYVRDISPGELPLLTGTQASLSLVAYTQDGGMLATGGATGGVTVWDADTGQPVLNFSTCPTGLEDSGEGSAQCPLASLDYAPDGSSLLTTSQDGIVQIWQAASGELLRRLADDQLSAVYSFDGARIATTGTDGAARIWDAASGGLLHELSGEESYTRAAFSQNGQRLLAVGTRLYVWDVEAEKLLQTVDAGSFDGADFSPDGNRILAGYGYGYGLTGISSLLGDVGFAVWDAGSGAQRFEVTALPRQISKVLFSPDGKMILTLSDAPQLWDAATGVEIIRLRGFDGVLTDADFSADGRRLVVAGEDGTARQYVVAMDDLLALALERAGRELSCSEREEYLGETGACDKAD